LAEESQNNLEDTKYLLLPMTWDMLGQLEQF